MLVDPEMVPVIRLPEGKLQVVLHRISATLISEDIFGSRIGSNVVLVGALHAILKIGDSGCIEAVLKEEWPDLAEKNITAFRKGIAVVNSSETS
jgi:Pyruvate/2-oxoacid:ferredoxin oxidoreductase gamma subunit